MDSLHGSALLAADRRLRGDPITGERYFSRDFAEQERRHVFRRVWHIAGISADLEDFGDYVVHSLGHESVLVVRQKGGGVRAFHNVCPHRGNRLVWGDVGGGDGFTCAYHSWKFSTDGLLVDMQDPEDFADGPLCGTLRLKELPAAEPPMYTLSK